MAGAGTSRYCSACRRYEWKFREAEQEFKRAINLDPNYSTAHQWYAFDFAAMGRLDEAVAEVERARQTDPCLDSLKSDTRFR